ncbi:MAG: FAD-dependent oxidoreductase, partial [Segetibacter sp.]
MTTLPENEFSYWMDSATAPQYPVLENDIQVDVAILGGGIAGLSSAYTLKKAGLTVAVLEKKTVGSGITGHTTGKVSAQHGLCYS